jgi:hypothetical protein
MLRRGFFAASAGALLNAAEKDFVEIAVGGKPATRFYSGAKWDKPFLYPLKTASGVVISRGWPIEPREGETNDHVWHRGVWYGHGIINGADFWRELGREKTSWMEAIAAPRVDAKKEASTVSVRLRMMTPERKTPGTIAQSYRIHDDGALRFIDATIAIHADAGQALTFGDTDDGGFAFRLSDAFREERGARLLNSAGQQGTKNIWGKAAKWVDYSAVVEGERRGAAIFDHPSNFRHPTTWHARGYALCAANPFGWKSFTKDPAKDGTHTIPVGGKLEFRYRVILHEGSFEVEEIERQYGRWAGGRG